MSRKDSKQLGRAQPAKKMSAKEALAAALKAEEEKALAKSRGHTEAQLKAAQKRKNAELAKQIAREAMERMKAVAAQKAAEEEARAAAPKRNPFATLPKGAVVLKAYSDIPPSVISLMRAHQSRAANQADLAGAMALAAVADAVETQVDLVTAARVRFHGEDWAVWVRGDILMGAFFPADLYLVGL